MALLYPCSGSLGARRVRDVVTVLVLDQNDISDARTSREVRTSSHSEFIISLTHLHC